MLNKNAKKSKKPVISTLSGNGGVQIAAENRIDITTQKTVRLLTHRIGVTLAIIRFLRYYKSSFFPSSSLKFSPTAELRKIGRCDGMVDVADSKSAGGDSVWVRVPPPAPWRVFLQHLKSCEDTRFFSAQTAGLSSVCLLYTSPSPRDRG